MWSWKKALGIEFQNFIEVNFSPLCLTSRPHASTHLLDLIKFLSGLAVFLTLAHPWFPVNISWLLWSSSFIKSSTWPITFLCFLLGRRLYCCVGIVVIVCFCIEGFLRNALSSGLVIHIHGVLVLLSCYSGFLWGFGYQLPLSS